MEFTLHDRTTEKNYNSYKKTSMMTIYKNHKVRFEFHNHAQSTANVMYQRISFYIEHGQLTDRNSAYKIIRTLAQSFLVQHASGLITKTVINFLSLHIVLKTFFISNGCCNFNFNRYQKFWVCVGSN